MNVVYIHTHDSGRCWEPYGYRIHMPNVMRIAKEGLLFRNAFCAAPTCSPSRAALLTGMAAHSSGMMGLTHRGFDLFESGRHMASFFSENGFETVLCGLQHEARDPLTLGYSHVFRCDEPEGARLRWDKANAKLACDYLRKRHERPFFLSYGMMNTHRPYPDHNTAGIDPDTLSVPWCTPDNETNRSDMADYCFAAQIADECVGDVLNTLRETDQMENTILIITTDHGIAWPFMKCSLYDTGIGVSLILRIPGMHQSRHVSDCLVSQIDLFPTLCELLHIAPPDWLQGTSLMPVIRNNQAVRSEIFAEVNYHSSYEPQRCIRTDRYKLILRFDDYLGIVATNIDPSPAKDALRQAGYMDWVHAREELYDLSIDPSERINLVQNPAYRHIYHELTAKLYEWMRATNDPLLTYRYRIPAPAHARINIKTGYSSEEKTYEAW